MYKEDLFSINITNYNGKDYVLECIQSVLESNYKNYEIIVIDNGSSDGSQELLRSFKKNYHQIKLIENEGNFGATVARNQGLRISEGEFVAFLDNDTKVAADWLDKAWEFLRKDERIGGCQCKLILDKERTIDSLGEYLGQFGFLVNVVAQGEKDELGVVLNGIDILSAKSAGVIFRKIVLEEAGKFDNDYFIYMGETDACWRVWLIGYKIKLCADSIVYHKFGTTSLIMPDKINYLVKFHGTKNYICTLIKNLSLYYLFKILPVHIFFWMGIALYFLLAGNIKSFCYILKGIGWNVYYLPRTIQKRREIQRKRRLSDQELFAKVLKRKPFQYYLDKFLDRRPMGQTCGWHKGE